MTTSILDLCNVLHKGCLSCIKECVNKYGKEINVHESKNKTENKQELEGFYMLVKDDVNTFIKIVFPLISIIGFIANILIIFVVLRLPSLRRSYTNFFLVNMALADLGVVIWCVNLTAIQYVDAELLWVVGPVLCKLNHFIQILSYTASILLLLLICLERYIAIIFPMKVKNMLSKRIYIILLILIWVISIGFSIPSLFTYELQRTNNITSCDNTQKISKKTYLISTFVLLYILPLVVMASLYGHICYSLVRSIKTITGSPQKKTIKLLSNSTTESLEGSTIQTSSKTGKQTNNPMKQIYNKKSYTKAATERRRVILMLIVIVIVFALCRLPRHVWSMMYLHSYSHNTVVLLVFPPSAYMVMYLSSAINPLIYFAFSNSFRVNFLKALCCYCPEFNQQRTNALLLSNSKYQK